MHISLYRRCFDTYDFALCCFHCEPSTPKELQKGHIQQNWASALKFTPEQKPKRCNVGLRYRIFGSPHYSAEFCLVQVAKHVPFLKGSLVQEDKNDFLSEHASQILP